MSGDGDSCGQCGSPITQDERDGRQPCASCGSLTRSYSIVARGGMALSGSASIRALTYPEVLPDEAQRFLESADYVVAVILSHVACEVAVARRLAAAFSTRGEAALWSAIEDGFLNRYNLASGRTRRLYTTVTGDEVQASSFWQSFCASAARRNAILHRGAVATQGEAAEGLAAARRLVPHLMR